MRTTEEICQGVLDWVLALIPELLGGKPYAIETTDYALPDVLVDCSTSGVTHDASDFPHLEIQQAVVYQWAVELSFLADNADSGEASQFLRTVEARTVSSLLSDGTLGEKVPFVSPFVSYDYTPPFIERPDGTRGREMTMAMLVGELIGGLE
jgi:hypothetical protein